MSDGDPLGDDALGDESAILPGAVLSEVALADAGAPAKLPKWSRKLLSITVLSDQATCKGWADVDQATLLGSCSTLKFYCFKPATFQIDILFHVDAEGIPRPTPFTPPGCRVDFHLAPDDGGTPQTGILEDKAPVYVGVGAALRTSFASTLSLKSPSAGTLTLGATLTDAVGIVSYNDQIRCVITPCVDGGMPIA